MGLRSWAVLALIACAAGAGATIVASYVGAIRQAEKSAEAVEDAQDQTRTSQTQGEIAQAGIDAADAQRIAEQAAARAVARYRADLDAVPLENNPHAVADLYDAYSAHVDGLRVDAAAAHGRTLDRLPASFPRPADGTPE